MKTDVLSNKIFYLKRVSLRFWAFLGESSARPVSIDTSRISAYDGFKDVCKVSL